jgi:hypothetical protein
MRIILFLCSIIVAVVFFIYCDWFTCIWRCWDSGKDDGASEGCHPMAVGGSGLAGNTIVRTTGTSSEEGHTDTHLYMGKARGIHGVFRPGAWPCKGIL